MHELRLELGQLMGELEAFAAPSAKDDERLPEHIRRQLAEGSVERLAGGLGWALGGVGLLLARAEGYCSYRCFYEAPPKTRRAESQRMAKGWQPGNRKRKHETD